ncbi:hypothetical protein MUK42_34134, partial [Musa troglodytarum]
MHLLFLLSSLSLAWILSGGLPLGVHMHYLFALPNHHNWHFFPVSFTVILVSLSGREGNAREIRRQGGTVGRGAKKQRSCELNSRLPLKHQEPEGNLWEIPAGVVGAIRIKVQESGILDRITLGILDVENYPGSVVPMHGIEVLNSHGNTGRTHLPHQRAQVEDDSYMESSSRFSLRSRRWKLFGWVIEEEKDE